MKRYHIIFRGRVQGVGFRFQTKMLADSLKLTGSVKNMDDGSVEVYIQGSKESILDFFKEIENLKFAVIDSKDINEVSLVEDETDFQMVY